MLVKLSPVKMCDLLTENVGDVVITVAAEHKRCVGHIPNGTRITANKCSCPTVDYISYIYIYLMI